MCVCICVCVCVLQVFNAAWRDQGGRLPSWSPKVCLCQGKRVGASWDIFPHAPPELFSPWHFFPFSRLMAASAWSLTPMVTKQTSSRTMVTFSTSPKFLKMNSTPRSPKSPGRPRTVRLEAMVLGGACGRFERGGLVPWLIFRFRRGTRNHTHPYNRISGFSTRGEALRQRGSCDFNPLVPL